MKIKLLFFLMIISFVNAQQKGKNRTKQSPITSDCFKPLILPKIILRDCINLDSLNEDIDKCNRDNLRLINENFIIDSLNQNSQKQYNDCISKRTSVNNKNSVIVSPKKTNVNNYDGYESVSVTTGDLGCSNVIPRYDYSLNTSLLVKNYGDLDLVIKLINLEDNIASRMVYIRKNSSFQIKNIPQGKYIIKEAHGEVWKQKNIDGKCVGIFTKNAMYRQGKNIPDFNIRKRIEGNYEVTEIPYYELELGIKIITKPGEKVRSTYQSNSITSSEFNK